MINPIPRLLWKPLLCTGLLALCSARAVQAQTTGVQTPIDSLITRLPAMMRSDEKQALVLIDALARQAAQQGHRHGLIQSLFFKAWHSYRHNPTDVALAKIDSALQHADGIQADTALVKFYILKGQCYVKKTRFDSALRNFNLALQVAEKRGDQVSKTSTMISIGWAYMEDGKPVEAIRFFSEVLRFNPSPQYDHRPVLLCNIAACYNTVGNFRKAEFYARQGITAARNRASNADLANGLNILARSLYQQGKLEQAIGILKEAAVVREKVADPSMLASDYLELADLYQKNGQLRQAIAWARKAEDLSTRGANSLKLVAVYQSLASAYEAVGDDRLAALYLKKILGHKDSLSDDHYNQAFARMQVQFETQKKTAENLQLKKENLEARLRNSQQQRWLVLLGAGVVLLVASGIYVSKLMKSRYRARLAEEQLAEQRRRTLAVMEAEEKERRRLAGDLHDGVGQTLAAAALQLAKVRKGNGPLDKVDELIAQAGSEVRSLSHQVTPELLLHYGLVRAMEQAVDRLNEAGDGTVFTLYTYLDVPPANDMAALTLYRCFQELCTNALKHARASHVTVQLTSDEDGLELMVEDDGAGFSPGSVAYGLGLKNMESRVALFEGECTVDSTPGRGTTVVVRLPATATDSLLTKTASA